MKREVRGVELKKKERSEFKKNTTLLNRNGG